MTGYDWNGVEMDPGEPIPNRFGASSLHTTTNDMVEYLHWNLDRFGQEGAEARAISHAGWVIRERPRPGLRHGRIRPHGCDGSRLGDQ